MHAKVRPNSYNNFLVRMTQKVSTDKPIMQNTAMALVHINVLYMYNRPQAFPIIVSSMFLNVKQNNKAFPQKA